MLEILERKPYELVSTKFVPLKSTSKGESVGAPTQIMLPFIAINRPASKPRIEEIGSPKFRDSAIRREITEVNIKTATNINRDRANTDQ